MEHLKNLFIDDREVYDAVEAERIRQNEGIELIASENFVSKSVLEAAGSVMTNKYAEGYPDKRYYGGCECVDIVEKLAIERAKKLFDVKYVNVQPHSGSQANMGVYKALLNLGDTVLGMKLDHGGHLTHGKNVNFSGKDYKIYSYSVKKDDEYIDYDEVERLTMEVKPKMIIAGASAYPRIIDFKRFTNDNLSENDEYVRVYCNDEFIGTGKLLKNNNTISLKSDKIFIE